MTQEEQKALEVYPIESHEMYDDLYRQRSIYKKGYQDALDSINNNEHLLETTNDCDDYYKTW